MKRIILINLIFLIFPIFVFGQNFTFKSDTLTIYGDPGDVLVLHADIENISQQELQLRISRDQRNLPPGWSSSLCSGEICYSPDTDVYTIPDELLGIPPLGVGQTAKFHINFYTDLTPNTASVLIRVENMNDVNEFIELTFTGSTQPSGIGKSDLPLSGSFRLYPNFPNPFNPYTSIPFEIGGSKAVDVQLSVFNILGQKVAILLNEKLLPGKYEAKWDARNQLQHKMPTGLYFYEIQVGTNRQLGEMMLIR